jgi:hypothetical protein
LYRRHPGQRYTFLIAALLSHELKAVSLRRSLLIGFIHEVHRKASGVTRETGTSILLAVSVSFLILVAALAMFDATGELGHELYRSTRESCLVAGILGSFAFAFCFFDFFSPNRFFTGAERAGFVRLICWLSVLLTADAFVESMIVPQMPWIRDGTWFLRWPAECILAGLLGIVAGISKKKRRWATWGMCVLLWGGFWLFVIFSE